MFHGYTVKPVLSGHSKIDKIQILMANGSLMNVDGTLSNSRSENPIFGLLLVTA